MLLPRFSNILLLLCLAFSTSTIARVMYNPQHLANQQPLQEPQGDITMTLHTTVTSYIATSTITAILTRYTVDSRTAVPEAVQTWYAGQREKGCDRTACASCRVWYRCAGLAMECVQCDGAPYCQCEV